MTQARLNDIIESIDLFYPGREVNTKYVERHEIIDELQRLWDSTRWDPPETFPHDSDYTYIGKDERGLVQCCQWDFKTGQVCSTAGIPWNITGWMHMPEAG